MAERRLVGESTRAEAAVPRTLLLATALEGHGGVQVVNRLVIDAFDDWGIPLSVLSLDGGSAVADNRPARIVKARFAVDASRRARTEDVEVVFVTHAGLAPAARASARGRRLVCWLHGVEAWAPLRRSQRWGLRGVDDFIASSAFTLDRFRQVHPDLAHIPGRVCPLPARTLGPGLADPSSSRTILSVGRLWGRGMKKGQDLLIESLAALAPRHPEWKLVVVGEGDGRADLQTLVERLGLAAQVELVGAVDDETLDGLYASAAFFALPSEGEGFGLVLAEAMAHGLPCLSSSLDAGGELIVHGRTGFAVDPNDPVALVSRLDDLMSDPELRATMGAAARGFIEAHHSLEQFRSDLGARLSGVT